MNRKLIATTVAIAMLSGLAFAQTGPAQEASNHRAASPEAQHQMHQHMEKMQATMEKIHTEEDAAVRKQLMHEHMQEMHTMMNMMGGMQCDGMMGDHMKGDHMMDDDMMKHDAADEATQSHEHE